MSNEIGDDKIKFALETWKTAIGVQQHFNTIEMQIRNIAVTVVTATLGAAALVFKQGEAPGQGIAMLGLTASDLIVFAGLIAWLSFYFMDRWWYHRLLQGAVEQAQAIEKHIGETAYGTIMSLSTSIRAASPFKLLGKVQVHSDTKIDIFYGVVAAVLILIILFAF